MKGFDEKFRDIPDYILRVTREIWEDRGIGLALERYYAPDVLVRAASGIITDNSGVVAATLQTLHEFPDRQLVGEDVIWRGDDEQGYFSSHRLISVMRHQGDGAFGPADGAVVRSRIIADCVIKNNRIVEEWLVRDQAAFAHCLGVSPRNMAERQVAHDLASTGKVRFFSPATDVAGSYVGSIDESEVGHAYRRGWETIWGRKTPAAISELYSEGAALFPPGGGSLSGRLDIDRFCLGYLAAFPDLAFEVDHVVVNRDPGQPVRIAMRWSAQGSHAGWGRFGEPTGAPVYIMGLTQAHMLDDKVVSEWVLIDDVAIWKQILAHGR